MIYSAAATTSPEVEAARSLALNSKHHRLPFLYHQFLGELSKYLYTICVTGTHGKSTTTALLGTTLSETHPRFALGMVGASVTQRQHEHYFLNPHHTQTLQRIVDHIVSPKAPSVTDIMKTLVFVVEADEYNKHFLRYDPDEAIITNVDYDHMDIYPTRDTYQETFSSFAAKVKHHLYVLPTAENESLFSHLSTYTPVSQTSFAFTHLLGGHNHANASLAFAAVQQQWSANDHPVSNDLLKKTLSHFKGLRRRAETLGFNHHGVRIISDYGHHPAELKSTLNALRHTYPDSRITVVFQPHQARRIIEFRTDFAEALTDIDHLLLYRLYAARENIPQLLEHH